MGKERVYWVDYGKVFACLLVLLGHFFQSMVKSGIVEESAMFLWFNKTIYYFHVPLFFLFSGYLYQRSSKVESFSDWKYNILKKAISLWIPYFSFSFATWLLKVLFSGSVNTESAGLVDMLFIHPSSPYWYLYALFFIFLVTPTFANRTNCVVILLVSLGMKLYQVVIGGIRLTAVYYVFSNEIWFVLGMLLCFYGFKPSKKNRLPGMGIILVFLLLSVLCSRNEWNTSSVSAGMTFIALVGFVLFFSGFNYRGKIIVFFSKYTMPIFLMHTLFAAPVRTVMVKLGIRAWVPHFAVGITVSIVGPIIAAIIMEKSKWLEFFIYPAKFIKISKK